MEKHVALSGEHLQTGDHFSSSFSTSAVDSAPVAMASLVSVQPGNCGSCAVACTAAASAGMLRDASVIEASTAPASAAEGSAGGDATDSTVCTAAHEGKTAAVMFPAAFAWLRKPGVWHFHVPCHHIAGTHFQGSTKKI